MFRKSDGIPIANLFGIDIQEHEDLGIGQPLQQLMTLPANEGGFGMALPGGTRELVLGMDGRNTGQYAKMPVRNPGLETFAIIAAILIGHRPLAIMDGWSVG